MRTQFSTMGAMISARRSSYTAENAKMRLTLKNQLGAKRKLEALMSERKVKKAKLFESN